MFRSRAARFHTGLARVVILALLTSSVAISARSYAQTDVSGADLLVYHQITNLDADYSWVASPELSADGQVIAFGDAPGSGDPAKPNRIMRMSAAGGDISELDSYVPLCYCSSQIAVSANGSVVVSTDSVQLRLVAADGAIVQLLTTTSNDIGRVRLTADGEHVFFAVRRDVGLVDDPTVLTRGIWRIDADGDDLEQIVSADDVAAFEGVAVDQTGCCFYTDGVSLDVSATGDAVVFAAVVSGTERIYTATGDGDDLARTLEPFAWVKSVAISADGDTVAYDAIPPDPSGENEVGVFPFAGGSPRILATITGSSFEDVLRLSEDGSSLLISPLGYLIDTETGLTRQLAVLTPGAPGQTSLLFDGLVRAAMSADATSIVYVMNSIVCADCANQHEQIGLLTIGPADLGGAPDILNPSITPDALTMGTDDRVTATVEVAYTGEIVSVGAVALRDGIYDVNVVRGAALVDDGTLGDSRPNDDTFTNDALGYAAYATRDDDTGPRTIRFQAETVDADGLHHATALDVGTLTIEAPPSEP